MTKKLLLKYIEGKASRREEQDIMSWVGKSEDNLKYYIGLKNLWIHNSMPDSVADKQEMSDLENIISYSVKGGSAERRKISGYFKFILYAASIVLLVSISLNIYMISGKETKSEIPVDQRIRLSDVPRKITHTIYTNKGVKGYVVLPDGSKVSLNSDTKITFPDQFFGSTREVAVSGEAFFDVVKDSTKPMIVSTNRNFVIKVMGTKFNIRSYENDDEAQTTLYSGSIKLIRKYPDSDKEFITELKPKESFLFKDNDRPVLIKQADTVRQDAWRRGELMFDFTPISEVIKKLERWHGAEFLVENKDILKYKLTANFKSESLVQIMEMIKYCSFIDYSIKDNVVTLSKSHVPGL